MIIFLSVLQFPYVIHFRKNHNETLGRWENIKKNPLLLFTKKSVHLCFKSKNFLGELVHRKLWKYLGKFFRRFNCTGWHKKAAITKIWITSEVLFRSSPNFGHFRSHLCSRHPPSFKSSLRILLVQCVFYWRSTMCSRWAPRRCRA